MSFLKSGSIQRAALVAVVSIQLEACGSPPPILDNEPSPRRCTAELRRVSDAAVTYSEDEVDEPTRMVSNIPRLRITDAMLEAWRPQSAVLAFIVDTTGRIDPCTVEVRAATHPDFRDAILAAVPLLRFTPARRAGKLVRQRAAMPWDWRPAS